MCLAELMGDLDNDFFPMQRQFINAVPSCYGAILNYLERLTSSYS